MAQLRILVTGGNGYVGRQLTRRLSRQSSVCVADINRYGGWRFTPAEQAALRLEGTDIRKPDDVARLMGEFDPDVVIHLAALHYIPECESNPVLAVDTNVVGTLNLLLSSPAGCRFVFASSGAVYRPHDRPHHEDTSELGPNDIYGFSKLHGEHYVREIAAKRGLRAAIVRLFNVVGPGETNPHLLPELVAQLKSGRRTVELGNLSPERDYIGVEDAARGFEAVGLRGAIASGETCVVNLGTSRAYSVAEIVDKLRRVSAIDFEVQQTSNRVRRVDRPFLAADNQRIAELFGWLPQHTIDDVLAAMWNEPDLAEWLMAQYR